MNICYFVDTFPVFSETFVLNEIDEVAQQGDDVFVVAINKPDKTISHTLAIMWQKRTKYFACDVMYNWSNMVALLGFFIFNPIVFFSALKRAKKIGGSVWWRFKRIFGLAAYIRKQNIQHIHVHFACNAAELAWIVHWLTGTGFSVSTHGYDIYVKPYPYIKELSDDAAFIRSVCNYNNIALQDLGVNLNKIVVIHCGVRVNDFKVEANINKDIDLICVARLHPVKGINFLLDAMVSIVKRNTDIKLYIAGDGEERLNLERQMLENGLSKNVKFLGFCSQNEIKDLLLRAKVYCLPSLGDSVGVATMEAMAMELPVISTRVKGIPELVQHGISGLLVEPGNASALENAIAFLFEHENERARLSVQARECIVADFNQEIEVRKLRALIAQFS